MGRKNTLPKSTEVKWLTRTIVEKLDAVSYKALAHNRGVWKRHADQIPAHHDHNLRGSPRPENVDISMFTEIPISEELSIPVASGSESDTTSLGHRADACNLKACITRLLCKTLATWSSSPSKKSNCLRSL